MKVDRWRPLAVLAAVVLGLGSSPGGGCANRQAAADPGANPNAMGLANTPSKARFRTYPTVELKASALAQDLEHRRDADAFARRTDAALKSDLERLLRKVEPVPRGVSLARTQVPTLQIVPRVEKARLVSTLSRGWLTWGAGDVDLIIRVAYIDGMTGEVLAEPVFRRIGSAFWGTWSNGVEDREVEERLVSDIVQYTGDNL